MTRVELQEFALAGAQARLRAISEERAAIIRMFPDLRTHSTTRADSLDGAASTPPRARKRRSMSDAQRKAVGRRMKAYWARRRAEKGQSARKSTAKSNRKRGMSAEARKAVGERMKAYWAARRAQTTNGGDGTQPTTASENGTTSRTSIPKPRRKQGRKK
jgi:hypothetical protein